MENYIGEIRLFASDYAPEGWVICDGRSLNMNENQPLFALIGTTYGGDGRTTFNVPDLRGRVPVCQNPSAASGLSAYAVGQKGGAETVTLSTSQIPSHTHPVNANATVGTTNTPAANTVLAGVASPAQLYVPAGAAGSSFAMNPGMVTNSGGNQPHNNMMPSIVLNYIIATTGIYPSA